MNNRNNRATRAIVASGSLLAIIFIAFPWVDEYLRLRREAVELVELETKLVASRQRSEQLNRVESKLSDELESFLARSVDPTKTESVRELLVECVRQSGGRIRRLDIGRHRSREWASKNDDARQDSKPHNGEASRFVLHTHSIELQIDGSLESIRQILDEICSHGWFIQTSELKMVPTGTREAPVKLHLRMTVYGLAPQTAESEQDVAQLRNKTKRR